MGLLSPDPLTSPPKHLHPITIHSLYGMQKWVTNPFPSKLNKKKKASEKNCQEQDNDDKQHFLFFPTMLSMLFNSLPNDKFSDWSKLKVFADEKINVS